METNYIIWNYAIYTVITLGITIWVAKVLSKNGLPFLRETFNNDETLTQAVNKLLNVGFYLVNVGYLVFTIKVNQPVDNLQILIETLGWKVGKIVLILGIMHFMNLTVLFGLRRTALARKVIPKEVPQYNLDR